jgi:hypothetical protein
VAKVAEIEAQQPKSRECQKFCVRDFREGGFPFWYIENTGINVTVSQFAWPHRAVKPQSRAAARRRRGA